MQAQTMPRLKDPRPAPARPPGDRFLACLDAVIAADPASAPWSRREGGPVGIGLLSALHGGPVGPEAVRALSLDAHMALFRRLYWQPSRAHLLPAGADRAMLALAITVGPHRAVLAAQRALGMEEDGMLDPALLPDFTPAAARALEAALDAARRALG